MVRLSPILERTIAKYQQIKHIKENASSLDVIDYRVIGGRRWSTTAAVLLWLLIHYDAVHWCLLELPLMQGYQPQTWEIASSLNLIEYRDIGGRRWSITADIMIINPLCTVLLGQLTALGIIIETKPKWPSRDYYDYYSWNEGDLGIRLSITSSNNLFIYFIYLITSGNERTRAALINYQDHINMDPLHQGKCHNIGRLPKTPDSPLNWWLQGLGSGWKYCCH